MLKNKMAKSDMLNISCNISETEELDAPFSMLAGKDKNILVIGLDGGADGTKEALSPSDFIGTDNGPGKRTGIQSFIDNDIVSIIAVPGVTDANVQLSLTAHCESLGKADLQCWILPRDSKKN